MLYLDIDYRINMPYTNDYVLNKIENIKTINAQIANGAEQEPLLSTLDQFDIYLYSHLMDYYFDYSQVVNGSVLRQIHRKCYCYINDKIEEFSRQNTRSRCEPLADKYGLFSTSNLQKEDLEKIDLTPYILLTQQSRSSYTTIPSWTINLSNVPQLKSLGTVYKLSNLYITSPQLGSAIHLEKGQKLLFKYAVTNDNEYINDASLKNALTDFFSIEDIIGFVKTTYRGCSADVSKRAFNKVFSVLDITASEIDSSLTLLSLTEDYSAFVKNLMCKKQLSSIQNLALPSI